MTALDIIVLLLVGLGIFSGFRKGLAYTILSLAMWMLIVLAMWLLHGPISRGLEPVIGTTSGAYVLAFAAIFALVFIGGKLVAARVSRGVRKSFVGGLDRLLGAGFGALKGLVYATLFYMAFSFAYDTIWGRDTARPQWIASAVTYPLVHGAANTFVDLVEARQRGGGIASEKAPAKAK